MEWHDALDSFVYSAQALIMRRSWCGFIWSKLTTDLKSLGDDWWCWLCFDLLCLFAAVIPSLPFVSILTLTWLFSSFVSSNQSTNFLSYHETHSIVFAAFVAATHFSSTLAVLDPSADDFATTSSGALVNIDVLANDAPSNDVATISLVQGTGGVAQVIGTQPLLTVDFQPDTGFLGNVVFSYMFTTVSATTSPSATVTVNVRGTGIQPIPLTGVFSSPAAVSFLRGGLFSATAFSAPAAPNPPALTAIIKPVTESSSLFLQNTSFGAIQNQFNIVSLSFFDIFFGGN
jgi:hypothetical protein